MIGVGEVWETAYFSHMSFLALVARREIHHAKGANGLVHSTVKQRFRNYKKSYQGTCDERQRTCRTGKHQVSPKPARIGEPR